MSAKGIFHDAVRKELEKEGWLIKDDPLGIYSSFFELRFIQTVIQLCDHQYK